MKDEQLKDYFSLKYRGRYYVQMKVIAARVLRDKGYSLPKIATILLNDSRRHETIWHYLNSYQDTDQKELIELNFERWIQLGLYPMSEGQEMKADNTRVRKHETKIKLTKHESTYREREICSR